MSNPNSRPASGASDLAQLGADLASRPYARRGIAMSNETIRVLLVDDHAMVREGLRLLLRTASDILVIGEADNGVSAVATARRLTPDIVVLDLDMPGGDGMAAVRELKQSLPNVRALILTVHPEHERLLPLLEAGARGYLTKEAASRELVEAIRVVATGEVYVRPAAARLLAAAVVPEPAARSARGRFQILSDRERTILRLVAEGYSGAEIARQLGISTKTVDAYKRRVQEKLGLEHRTDYVRFAIEAGILG
ncbi:MAG TPA: response regulator transcription factor [Gemmatimonadales bacterium]|jgi:two-component system response regulator NreC|nr:response regulator transcription factor [Gemmatimonadales bacterium]